jgi:hypothetical protein
MDFSQARHPIDGVFPYLLAIRDLASHQQLAWRPVRGQTADDVLPVLQELFTEHGAPLVLKSDRGSAFIALATRTAMLASVVAQLFSPPGQPQYNGALERSNGVLKTYTHQHALSEGHPFRWTSDDLEHARQLANTVSRPWGHRGPTPDEAWQQRTPLGQQQRRAFQASFAQQRTRAAEDLGLALSEELSFFDGARLDRLALSRTLQDLGYLTMIRVRRPEKKPKRLSREELARRKSAAQGSMPALDPPASSNSPPTKQPTPSGVSPEEANEILLAETHRTDTMQQVNDSNAEHPVLPQAVTSARRERTFTSWLRRPFTPLLSLLKAAKITR